MHHSRGGRCAWRAQQETRARRALHADLGSLDPYRVGELATCPDGHLFDRPQLASMETSWGRSKRRSEEHTSELQSRSDLVCRLLLEKKKKKYKRSCSMRSR